MIAYIVRTDGRREYLPQAIASAQDNLKANFSRIFIVDDSGDDQYAAWLDQEFPTFEVVHHAERRGMNECARTMVKTAVASGADYAFSTEDDFVFNSTVNVKKMARLLHCEPHIGQLVLKRQPVNTEEIAAGGFMGQFPERYTDHACPTGHWVESTQIMFSGNPSLVRVRALEHCADIEMPSTDTYEVPMGLAMYNHDYALAFYGRIEDKPRCHHLGDIRSSGYRW